MALSCHPPDIGGIDGSYEVEENVAVNAPVRLIEKEILDLTGWTKNTLNDRIYKKGFPKKITSSRRYGRIFNGADVYEYLGFIKKDDKEECPLHDHING